MDNLQIIEKYLDSREVAEMVEKLHNELLKDIRRYIAQFNEGKIPFVEFFIESTYSDKKGEIRPCYKITRKGCEFIAHKLTGTKGTIFTARYINRFHEMEDILTERQQERPWFIRHFRGTDIILERDFTTITGVDIRKHKSLFRNKYLVGGRDYNGWGWKCDNEKFKKEYGFDYGDNACMMYFYLRGAKRALNILKNDRKITMNPGASKTILDGIKAIEKPTVPEITEHKRVIEKLEQKPVKITIVLKQNEIETVLC